MGGLLHHTICQTQFMNRLINTERHWCRESIQGREKLAIFRTYKECDNSFNKLKYSLLLRERFMSSWTKARRKSIHCLDLFTQRQWSCNKWWMYVWSRIGEVIFFQIYDDNNVNRSNYLQQKCQILIVSDTNTNSCLHFCFSIIIIIVVIIITIIIMVSYENIH